MTNAEYLRRFNLLKSVFDFNFKPSKKTVKHGGEKIGFEYNFTPAQKGRITKLSSEKTDDNKRKNSHLYNVARNVAEGNATFVKIKKSKYLKQKLKSFKNSGIFSTNSGVVVFSPNIENVEIKKRGGGYKIEYVVRPKEITGKNVKRAATFARREVFIPIPLYIWQSEDLLNIFLTDLEREYTPFVTRLAVNGRMGKTKFKRNDMYKYIVEDLHGNFVTDTPYITGVYLIFKVKVKQI